MSGGLWDAGAAISVGGRHVANWLIGQVRDETQTEDKIRAYAREIGTDETTMVEAFYEVPAMSYEQFKKVAQALFTLANQLSSIAYQNVQQARFITDLKRAEAERIRLNADLAAKNVELEQVVYVASHDLRSPLVNIDGYSKELGYAIQELRDALEEAPAETRSAVAPLLEQDIPEALRFIRASASKMDTLLRGLLRLSRSGRATLAIEPVNMNALMANVINSTEFQIQEAGVELEVADLPPCQSDAVQVNQIFSNLLSNALKYLDPSRPGVIGITGRTEGKRSVYCVEDNGIGIAPAHLDKIFEIFHQLDPAHSEGEGLGLTIIKRILGRLEGEIWVESEPGLGSRFYVALPAGRNQGEMK
jgi:signal transduction histidine kinase